MKCDSCIFCESTRPNTDEPYGSDYCLKGHWQGFGDPLDDKAGKDLWADCKDYEEEK